MLKAKKIVASVASASVAVTAFATVAIAKSPTIDLNAKINLATPGEPGTLDQSLIQYIDDAEICMHFSEGLTRLDTNSKVIPGEAEKWTHSADYKTWTFTLRKGLKWSNGTPVTAKDYVFGWQRVVNPATGSLYAYMMEYVKNAHKLDSAKSVTQKDLDTLGVKAVNDNTLVVTLETPTTYFPSVLANQYYFPLNEAFFNKHKKDYAKEASDILYNGPYVMKSWKHGANITLERNTDYWNVKNIKIKTISFDEVTDTNTIIQRLIAGKQDACGVPGSFKALVESKGFTIHTYNRAGIYWLKMNEKSVLNGKKVFSNANIRKAFALAFDRKQFIATVLKDASTPATGIIPDGIAGLNGDFRSENGNLWPASAQVKEAKAALKLGLKQLGLKSMPTVTYLTMAQDLNKKIATFAQQQFKQNLGVDVKVSTMEGKAFQAASNAGNYDLAFSGWSPDYNDPMTFLAVFTTDGGNNDSKYSNKKFDALLDQANKTADPTKRMNIMKQAEKIFCADYPVIPLEFDKAYYTTAKNVHDYARKPFLPDPDITYAYMTK